MTNGTCLERMASPNWDGSSCALVPPTLAMRQPQPALRLLVLPLVCLCIITGPSSASAASPYIDYFDDVLGPSPGIELTAALSTKLFEELTGVDGPDSLWIGMEKLERPQSELERLAGHLLTLVRPQLVTRSTPIAGAEVWVQLRKPPPAEEASLHFHYDKDEAIAQMTGELHHPELSSILYLTDAGGPTMIVNQVYTHNDSNVVLRVVTTTVRLRRFVYWVSLCSAGANSCPNRAPR